MTLRTLFVLCFTVLMVALLGTAGRAAAPLPADGQYVTASPSGHLQLGGRPVRYWGFIGHMAVGGAGVDGTEDDAIAKKKVATYKRDIDAMVDRIDGLGFNLVRSWEGGYGGVKSFLDEQDYTVGDGSKADGIAYYFKKLDDKGIKLWMSSTNILGAISFKDVGIISDPATAKDWTDAMEELQLNAGKDGLELRYDGGGGPAIARLFDPRWEALVIKRLKQFCDFPNKYKGGLRIGDDPQVATWELTNEEFAFRGFYYGSWQKMHPFFRNELLGKWQAFLKAKYGDDAKLKVAWHFLLPGESLAEGTILFAPTAAPTKAELAINDTNPNVIATLKGVKSDFSRDDFVRQRGADVVEFVTGLILTHKQRLAAALRSAGKSCRLSPIIFDSGNDFQIQSAWMHQNADAVSTCCYWKGMGYDPTDRRFPFFSALDAPPRTCWDVPWLEQSTMVGKPHFVYETNVDNRTKYRAEYPLRIAALASIQDWDIVCWHVYGGRNDFSKPKPFAEPIHAWNDYFEYSGDEVLLSAIKSAGAIFRNHLVPPAPKPTVFTFGKHSLYDPASMDYGKSYGDAGPRFIPTTYRYGSRVRIDPTRDDDAVEGPTIRPDVYEPCPFKPNNQIAFDWHRGQLTFDAPGVASYVGFFAQYGADHLTFNNGVTVSNITFANDEDIAFPVKNDEKYMAFTLASLDGLPLEKTRHAMVSAVSTSFNYQFKLDTTRGNKGNQQNGPDPAGPREFFGAWTEAGGPPVEVARVGAVVHAPQLTGMKYVLRDIGLGDIGRGTVADGTLHIPAEKPIMFIELSR